MNIKDTYLHGGTHIVKKIEFIVPTSGLNNAGKVVMRTTWTSVNSSGIDDTTDTVISILNATAFSKVSRNKVLAGPAGSQDADNTPTFRSLVAADIPGTLGTTTFTGNVSVGDADHTSAALSVKGNTTIGGNLTVNGNTTLGNEGTDTLTIKSSAIEFPNATMLDWNNGTYRQRLVITDSSDDGTKVFKFQQSTDSGATYGDLLSIDNNGKVTATTFTGALSGNATTATNLSKGTGRGFLYQSADTTTSCLGVPLAPSISGNTHIGIPTLTRANGSNTINYVLDVSLFIKKDTLTYLGDNIKSSVFVKTNTTSPAGTLDGSSSSSQGSTGSGSGISYAAGTGLKLSGTTFSTNTWTGTQAQFNALSAASANSYDVIYIIEE